MKRKNDQSDKYVPNVFYLLYFLEYNHEENHGQCKDSWTNETSSMVE